MTHGLLALATTLTLTFLVRCSHGLDNGVALTPPMGWSTWNTLACDYDEGDLREIANIMVNTGLTKLGYVYFNIDDCWEDGRDAHGRLRFNATRFPSGMAGWGSYLHNLGMKFGIYTSSGQFTCSGYEGSWGHEFEDAQTFADWEVDFMKLDCCNSSMEMKNVSYPKWSKALNATGRPIVYSCDTDELIGIFPWTNEERPWEWGPSTCNMWRTWKDIKPYWWSWTMNLAFNIETWDLLDLSTIAHPGAWNDPDMLEVGVGDMTYEESKSHFSLWAMMAAPLILGNDLRHMTPQTLEIISNAEVIAIDQDPLGRQGRRVIQGIDSDIYAKPLAGGAIAVALWNKVNYPLDITLNWSDLGFAPSRSMMLRDLWAHRDLGAHTQSFSAKGVPSTGVIVLKLSPPPGQPALHPLTDPRIYA